MPSLRPCCGTSVGVIIADDADRLLMITRGWYPTGIAPVGGHDDHGDSVVAEVGEEVGLTVTSYDLLATGFWLPNLCASPPAPIPGHHWRLAHAQVVGTLAPDPIETRGAAYYTPAQIETLAQRTMAWARAQISDAEFAAEPGLEPVWVELAHRAGLRTATSGERALARRLYTTPPAHYWDEVHQRQVPVEEYATTYCPAR